MTTAAAVQGETIGETAYRRMRADIVFGRLAPGEKLRLDRVSKAYGASVSTLRELLNRLCSEGLIVAEGQRGFEVAPVSQAEWREVAAMRQLLECHAMEQSFLRGDLDWEAAVVSAHHKLAVMEKRMIAGDGSGAEMWKRCDWQFHHALISACGSKVLLDTHAAIYDKYLRYQMIAVVFRGEIAALQHAELLRCALARDFPAAREVLIAHIQECVDDTIARGTDWETPSPSTRAAEGRAKRGRNRDDAPVAPGSRSGRGRPAQDEKLRAARR